MVGFWELLEKSEAGDAEVSIGGEYFGLLGDVAFADITLDSIGGMKDILNLAGCT